MQKRAPRGTKGIWRESKKRARLHGPAFGNTLRLDLHLEEEDDQGEEGERLDKGKA